MIPRESRGVLGRAASARGIRARPGRNAQGARGNAGIAAPPGILRESRVRSGARHPRARHPRAAWALRPGSARKRGDRGVTWDLARTRGIARDPHVSARIPGCHTHGARGNAGVAASPGIPRESRGAAATPRSLPTHWAQGLRMTTASLPPEGRRKAGMRLSCVIPPSPEKFKQPS